MIKKTEKEEQRKAGRRLVVKIFAVSNRNRSSCFGLNFHIMFPLHHILVLSPEGRKGVLEKVIAT